jgi:hypothetical protein
MCCPGGQRIADMYMVGNLVGNMVGDLVGDALAKGGSTSYGGILIESDLVNAPSIVLTKPTRAVWIPGDHYKITDQSRV